MATTYSKNTKKLTKHFSTIQQFIICLVLTLLLPELLAVSSSGKLVTYLPGLPFQPLPFHLETGYIGVGDSESSTSGDNSDDYQLFYYFFKSEGNPKEDPLILWLAGGPRCSALSAVIFEIGPVYMTHGENITSGSLPTLTLNPNSWTKLANIIFLDQPVHSGFSYSKSSHDSIMSDSESAKNTYEFLIKWLIQNPEFQSNPLYVAGNSYSGMIVPNVVQDIIRDIEDGTRQFLNFKGYSLGNPVTYPEMESNSKVEFAHNMGLVSYELYQSMRVNCNGNFLNFDLSNANCSHDRHVYEDLISGINPSHVLEPLCTEGTLTTSHKPKETLKYRQRRRSLKKISKVLSDEQFHYSCWRLSELSEHWANDVAVRKALHVREGTVGKWIRCNWGIGYHVDVKSSIGYHRNISTKGYRSLIYSGDHDMEVPHISTESWIRSLVNLSIVDEWRPWFVNGQIAGYTRAYSNGLTYASVKGAGHDATGYNPDECYAMFERWISHKPL
ncbi:hypothetical protein MKW98_015393 [Papaver atlanticum]|uniref:Uncharacterized protein n=1 Tax=Papaver atlanticum TaxID=357466 RepID=A0AAD4RY85_9MAGN|nr:hypothetical protein MKW98_015393 [Papaver atlanticum]